MPSFSRKHCYHCSNLKKRPVIQPENTMEKTWRKPTENPRSSTPSFSRKHCYHCSDLKKRPVIQPHDGENVEKTHRKPKEQHALVFQKTLLPLLWFEKTPYYPATRWRKHGENPQKTQEATCPRFSENTATTAPIWKNALLSSHTIEKTWRKPIEKPRRNTPLTTSKGARRNLAGKAWRTGERREKKCWIKHTPTYWIFK